MKSLNYWIKNNDKRKRIINQLIRKKVIKSYFSKELIGLFFDKAEYNLKASFDNININYFDWAINASYYSAYMASQALLLRKGFVSKSHKATILLLIDNFLNNGLTKEEIDFIFKSGLIPQKHLLLTIFFS